MVEIFTGSVDAELKQTNPSLDTEVEVSLGDAKADNASGNASLGDLDKLILQDLDEGTKAIPGQQQGGDASPEGEDEEAIEGEEQPDALENEDGHQQQEEDATEEDEGIISGHQIKEYKQSMEENRKTIKSLVEQLNVFYNAVPSEPVKPSTDEHDDPGEWNQYRSDLSFYKAQKQIYDNQFKHARQRIDQINSEQIATFSKYRKPDEVNGFSNWLKASPEMQDVIRYGSKSIDTVYEFYLIESGIQPRGIDKKAIAQKQAAQGYTAPKTSRGSAIKASQYPFSEKYKAEAQALKRSIDPVTGRAFTPAQIERMIKLDVSTRQAKGGY